MKKPVLSILGIIVLVLLLASAHPGAVAQDPDPPATPPERPPLPLDGPLGESLFADPPHAPDPGPDVGAAVSLGEIGAWSRIVFQSYRDDNWEIYIGSRDGKSQVRLTRNEALDVQPRLNPGCTRIVFASTQSSRDYELFAMNLDGKGLVRLTDNTVDDTSPAWSPDGTRIAFQRRVDGQQEIFVMNANGSGQTRLTDSPDFDASPTWSPDGTRIAFVSRRTGGYRIWVMNADGSDQRQLSNQPYSEAPAWSPDGSQIAYDANGDTDLWQELWLMNADGSNQRQVFGLFPNQDVFVNDWSPDGKRVVYTGVEWFNYQGRWYLYKTTLRYWSPDGGGILGGSGERDMNPDWQTMDTRAPVARRDPQLSYARVERPVSWMTHDLGGSGLRGVDVQVQESAGGGWQTWQEGNRAGFAYLEATPGQPYRFRLRAQDNALNAGAWSPPDGDAPTIFYRWRADGTVRDNAGAPISGMTLTTTPAAFQTRAERTTGAYTVLVGDQADAYELAVDKEGYEALPSTSFIPQLDARVDLVLSPADNVVQNGGFESGDPASGEWETGGTITPTITDEDRHTGRYAARLGDPALFGPSVGLSDPSIEKGCAQIWIDRRDTVHTTWYDEHTSTREIYYAQKPAGGTWTEPASVSRAVPLWGGCSTLVVDGKGSVHVVWADGIQDVQEVYYARRDGSGTWSPVRNLSDNTTNSLAPRIAVGGDNVVHITWADGTSGHRGMWYVQRSAGGAWSAPYVVTEELALPGLSAMAADASGQLHLVGAQNSNPPELWYARRSTVGTWSKTVVERLVDHKYTYGLRLALDRAGGAHMVWHGGDYKARDRIYYLRRDASGTWSRVQPVSADDTEVQVPSVAVTDQGVVHMTWAENGYMMHARILGDGTWSTPLNVSREWIGSWPFLTTGQGRIPYVYWFKYHKGFYTRQKADGTWTTPIRAPGSTGSDNSGAMMSADGDGAAHMVWGGSQQIVYAGPAAAAQAGTSSLAQALTLPPAASHPTLSFFYQLRGASDGVGNQFEVRVQSGTRDVTQWSTAADTEGWVHRSLDASEWAGEAVTLTFAVRQAAGQPNAVALVDEVSLGSTYPDLWVHVVNRPQAAFPGQTVVHTLSYGNRGGADARGVSITDTLPAELTYVAAQPAPTTTGNTLTWDVGDLDAHSGPYTIVLTTTVASGAARGQSPVNSATIAASSTELETENNVARTATWIGSQLYLPLTVKE